MLRLSNIKLPLEHTEVDLRLAIVTKLAIKGGDLGWADPANWDPAFSAALAKLKIDEISKPFRTSFGWHIVQLTGQRTLDATKQMNESKANRMLYNRKFGIESARWIKELRDEAYIEVFERDSK